MPATKATPFRFTPDELALIDELVKRRRFPSRVALLRRLVAEEADRTPEAPRNPLRVEGGTGWVAPPATTSAPIHNRTVVGGYSDPKDCPHPIGRRIGKLCPQCGAEPK